MSKTDGVAQSDIRVGVRELRGRLTHYLRLAESGSAVHVTSRDVVIAEIHAPAPVMRPRRQPGAMRGRIWIAEDFDVWPIDILDSFES